MEKKELAPLASLSFGELLKTLRKRRRLRQQVLADKLGVHRNTLGVWESGGILPKSKTMVLELARQLDLNDQETRLLLEASLTAVASRWHVPYQRNPFFTGRHDLLQHLHQVLLQEQTATLTQSYALSGLGGIGKTQTALEYAYRHVHDYAAIFWVGAETSESLISSFAALAEVLNLPERKEPDQDKSVAAVLRWLTAHQGWLLIFDNVEDLELVKRFLPTTPHGSLLFTTRNQAMGTLAQRIELPPLSAEEGTSFLLQRAKQLEPGSPMQQVASRDLATAAAIHTALNGLPLALDQAGAYIEETQCSLADYLALFQAHPIALLHDRQAHLDHPFSVVKTFTLALEQVEQANPAAADLLRLCAFLYPDAIPEELFTTGAMYLGPRLAPTAEDGLAFNKALAALGTIALLHRQPAEKTFSIHRLVQVVLQGSLEESEQHIWAERAMLVVNALFPHVESTTWFQCERLLTHALLSAQYIEHYKLLKDEARSLLSRMAFYLKERARYREAEPLYQQALRICEQSLGPDHPEAASLLNGLADLYFLQGKYREAEPLFRRAVRIVEQNVGREHADVASLLNGLAVLYHRQGRYGEAEPLYQQALFIWKQRYGPEHPQVASSLNGLASLYYEQGKYAEAEPLFQQALSILQQHMKRHQRQMADSLNGLALLYYEQGKYVEAEPLFQQAILIWEECLGHEHPVVAVPLRGLAHLYREQGKYAEAEPLYQRSLRIREQSLGTEHPSVAHSLRGLAHLYYEQQRYTEAEPLYQRALHIIEQSLGAKHPSLAYVLNGLAVLYKAQGRYGEAEPLFRRELQIWEQSHGSEHPLVSSPLRGLAHLYREQGKYAEAELLYLRALHIREQAWGPEHPETAKTVCDLAQLWEAQDNYEQARIWYMRALAIREQVLGAHHPKTTEIRQRLTALLHTLGQQKEAARTEP